MYTVLKLQYGECVQSVTLHVWLPEWYHRIVSSSVCMCWRRVTYMTVSLESGLIGTWSCLPFDTSWLWSSSSTFTEPGSQPQVFRSSLLLLCWTVSEACLPWCAMPEEVETQTQGTCTRPAKLMYIVIVPHMCMYSLNALGKKKSSRSKPAQQHLSLGTPNKANHGYTYSVRVLCCTSRTYDCASQQYLSLNLSCHSWTLFAVVGMLCMRQKPQKSIWLVLFLPWFRLWCPFTMQLNTYVPPVPWAPTNRLQCAGNLGTARAWRVHCLYSTVFILYFNYIINIGRSWQSTSQSIELGQYPDQIMGLVLCECARFA